MKKRRRKGFDAERELVRRLKDKGIWATRIPVSGVAQPLPDVLAVSNGTLHGFEVKSTSNSINFYKKSFDNTILWLEAMRNEKLHAKAWLAVRFLGGKWRFYELTSETEKIEANLNNGLTLSQLLKLLREHEVKQ